MIFPFPFIAQTPPPSLPAPPFWLHFSDNPQAETDTDETDTNICFLHVISFNNV